MSAIRIEGITFPVALRILLFKLCYTEKLRYLLCFQCISALSLPRLFIVKGNNILQNCLIPVKSYGVC